MTAGAVLRLYHLDRFSFWLDETIQYGWASERLSDILFWLLPDQMFLTTYLSHLQIVAGLGDSVWSLRLPSAVFGTATVLALGLLARALFGNVTGIATGAIAVVWPPLLVYSQEFRPYALQVLLITSILYFAFRAYRTNAPAWWCLLSGASILYLYNHMTSPIGVICAALAIGLWVVMDSVVSRATSDQGWIDPLRRLLPAAASFGAILAGYVPGSIILWRFIQQTRIDPLIANVKSPLVLDISSLSTIFGTYLGVGEGTHLLATSGLFLIGFAWATWRAPHAVVVAFTSIVLPLLIFSWTSGGGSVMNADRYLLFIIPMYLVLIGAGVVVLGHGLARGIAWAAGIQGFSYIELPPFRGRPSGIVSGAWSNGVAGLMILVCLAWLIGPRVWRDYEANPKQIPVDLASGYGYVLNRVRPGDVLLETSVAPGIPTGFFESYDQYFLRSEVRPSGVLVARFGKDARRQGSTCLTLTAPSDEPVCLSKQDANPAEDARSLLRQIPQLSAARGRLWILATTTPTGEALLRDMAEGQGELSCFQQICALGPKEGESPNVPDQLRTYVAALVQVAT